MLGAVSAHDLVLLDVNEDLIGETHVDKGVQATAVLLHKLSLVGLVRVIDEDEALLSSR